MKNEQTIMTTSFKGPPHDGVRSEHPAFGVVSVVRVSGQTRLFDSEFRHQHYITMKVSAASSERTLSRNWIHRERTPVVELSMSEAQWARMISAIGQDEGTPCTLQRVAGESIPAITGGVTARQQHVDEFAEHMQEVTARLDALTAQIDEAKMTKTLKAKLASAVAMVRTAATSNMRFVADSFSEHMEATVEAAKIEIHSFAAQAAGRQIAPPDADSGMRKVERQEDVAIALDGDLS